MAVQPMQAQVITVQPGITTTAKTQMWSSSLCDCCEDMSVCCFGFWCPCCLACQINSDFGECLCMPLLDLACGGVVPPATMAIRSAMRERYHIQGSLCDDCCIVTCCTVCAWCQMAREIKRHRHTLLLDASSTTVAVNINHPQQMPYAYPPQPLYQAPMGHPPMS